MTDYFDYDPESGMWQGRTYSNMATWKVKVIYGDDQPKVPPNLTTEEFERDSALGITWWPFSSMPSDNRKTS